jgi:hypothetical protein
MIPQELLEDTFSEIVEIYQAKLDLKSKMRFNIYILDDVPQELKADIKARCQTLANCIGRSRFELDHPVIYKKNDTLKIKSGIWSVRIF